jgi:hypothetical protein
VRLADRSKPSGSWYTSSSKTGSALGAVIHPQILQKELSSSIYNRPHDFEAIARPRFSIGQDFRAFQRRIPL